MRRRLRATAVVLLLAGAVVIGSSDLWVDEHRGLLEHVNYFRRVSGLPSLQTHPDLEEEALRHAREMAERREMFHSTLPELRAVSDSGWSALGENVGVGATVEDVMQGWFESPDHRAVLLGDYRWIGVGNYRGGGRVWVVVVLMR